MYEIRKDVFFLRRKVREKKEIEINTDRDRDMETETERIEEG